ncbi:MAG: hypothetical protein NTV52_06425 [Acidobacteria bacterium]|nr:hypothetical protein [Acidobacteriota bacterium]
MPSLTGLQSSILRSSQAFTGVTNATVGPISVLLAQVQGLALDSLNIAAGDPAALASNQNQMQRALLSLRDLAQLRPPKPLSLPFDLPISRLQSNLTVRPARSLMALSITPSVAEVNTQSILAARPPAPRPPSPPDADVVVVSPPLRSLEDSIPPTTLLRDPTSVAELANATSQQITSSVLGNSNQTAALVASLLRG